MIKIKGPIILCDVDDTLIEWDSLKYYDPVSHSFGDTIIIEGVDEDKTILTAKPIYSNVNELKKLKAQGFTIMVWSAAGEDWAEAVVNALGINDSVVSVVGPKCHAYYDDLPCEEFMGKRRFKK